MYFTSFVDMPKSGDTLFQVVNPVVGPRGHHILVNIEGTTRKRSARDMLNSDYDIEAEQGRLVIKERELAKERELVASLTPGFRG